MDALITPKTTLNGYERNALFHGRGKAGFANVAHICNADRIEDGRSVAVGDLDRDGDLDLLIQNYKAESCLLLNERKTGNWLQFRLRGVRSNRDAIGSRIQIQHGNQTQSREIQCGSGFLACQSLVAHFGLGDVTTVDRIDIHWPSGIHQVLRHVEANQHLAITEPKTSATTAATGQ
jgi:hypothetical protein